VGAKTPLEKILFRLSNKILLEKIFSEKSGWGGSD
jgi:hypothetical protein